MEEERVEETAGAAPEAPEESEEYRELNERYLRLYAEFDNYKKRAVRDREETEKRARESIIAELLPSIDNLETALKHAGGDSGDGLREGVVNTLRELSRTLEKFGLKVIEAHGGPFDPEYHHAMALVERDDVPDKTVVEEFRKGYMLGDRVIRASLVAVSCKPAPKQEAINEDEIEMINEED